MDWQDGSTGDERDVWRITRIPSHYIIYIGRKLCKNLLHQKKIASATVPSPNRLKTNLCDGMFHLQSRIQLQEAKGVVIRTWVRPKSATDKRNLQQNWQHQWLVPYITLAFMECTNFESFLPFYLPSYCRGTPQCRHLSSVPKKHDKCLTFHKQLHWDHRKATSISYQCGEAHGSTFHLMEPVEMWHPSSFLGPWKWQAQEARRDWHYRNGSQNDEQELTITGIRRIDSSGTRLACWNYWIRKHRHLRHHHRRRCHGRNMSSRDGRFLLFLFALLQPQQQQKSSLLKYSLPL